MARAVAERLRRRFVTLRRRGYIRLKRCDCLRTAEGKYHITPYILMSYEL